MENRKAIINSTKYELQQFCSSWEKENMECVVRTCNIVNYLRIVQYFQVFTFAETKIFVGAGIVIVKCYEYFRIRLCRLILIGDNGHWWYWWCWLRYICWIIVIIVQYDGPIAFIFIQILLLTAETIAHFCLCVCTSVAKFAKTVLPTATYSSSLVLRVDDGPSRLLSFSSIRCRPLTRLHTILLGILCAKKQTNKPKNYGEKYRNSSHPLTHISGSIQSHWMHRNIYCSGCKLLINKYKNVTFCVEYVYILYGDCCYVLLLFYVIFVLLCCSFDTFVCVRVLLVSCFQM